jgi:hypothetical protein
LEESGKVVRRYSSEDKPPLLNPNDLEIPTYWIRPTQVLSTHAGMHRFIWDLHYGPAPAPEFIPMTAIVNDTPAEPTGPWAMPGKYKVRLTVNGVVQEQPLTLRMDPRVTTSRRGLAMQFEMGMGSWNAAHRAAVIESEIAAVRAQNKNTHESPSILDVQHREALEKKLAALLGDVPAGQTSRFRRGLSDRFGAIYGNVQGSDTEPPEGARGSGPNVDRNEGERAFRIHDSRSQYQAADLVGWE